MRFSIAIPLHRDGPMFRRCLEACLQLDHDDYEVLVVSDRAVDVPDDPRVRAVLTGAPGDTSPAEKRDAAAAVTTGDAIAYLDDDAFPARDWLRVAQREFEEEGVGALGGPGITPRDSSLRARVGGAVYESPIGSGPLTYRFRPGAPREVDDYPAYNLIVRADAVRRAGGWASTLYGGEDTRFCEALGRVGVSIHYRPDLVVHHHRRPVFRAHMHQIANVGRHRGHFARTAGSTSRRPFYAAPSLCLLAAPAAALALARRYGTRRLAEVVGGLYAVLALASPAGGWRARAVFPAALVAHHASYAGAFLAGLGTRRLER